MLLQFVELKRHVSIKTHCVFKLRRKIGIAFIIMKKITKKYYSNSNNYPVKDNLLIRPPVYYKCDRSKK